MKYKHVFLFSLFIFSSISLFFYVNIPTIWPDEVLFFNPAWELKNNGIMRSSVLDGLIPGMDTHTLWMPPLYMIFLSWVFQIFPSELITARLFSSFISLGSILIVYRICLNLNFSSKRIIGVLLLLSTDFLFLKFSHTARMESLCLFFALASFFFLLRNANLEHSENSTILISTPTSIEIFLSGTFLSLSFLSHPFGIVHSIPVLFLLYQRRSLNFRNLALYTIAGIIPIALWGIYVIPNWELFIVQFGAQFSRKNELLGKFSWIDKGKIIFSVFKFPIIKLVLFSITIAVVFYNLFNPPVLECIKKLTSFMVSLSNPYFLKKYKPFDRLKVTLSKRSLIKELKTSPEYFFLIWLFTILSFLYISSESWYVFHMVVPFTFLLSSLIDNDKKFFYILIILSSIYNLFVIIWVFFSSYFLYKIPEKNEKFFQLIEKEVESKNNIYIQAIPDPYFYLKKKFPGKTLHEFIPGELSGMQNKNPNGSEKIGILRKFGIAKENYKIDANFYKDTIHKQEVFLFYNEVLMNDYIRTYLGMNSDQFERKILKVETPKYSDIKLEVVIYRRK